MRTMMRVLLASSVGLTLLAGAGTALALPPTACSSLCAQHQVAAGGVELVFGEAADGSGTGLGYLATCEQPVGGGALSYAALTACTASLSSTNCVDIVGSSSQDYIGPLTASTGTIDCGEVLIGLPYAEAKKRILQRDGAIEEDGAGLTSPALGIALYADGAGKDPSVRVESLLAFRRGYYDEP